MQWNASNWVSLFAWLHFSIIALALNSERPQWLVPPGTWGCCRKSVLSKPHREGSCLGATHPPTQVLRTIPHLLPLSQHTQRHTRTNSPTTSPSSISPHLSTVRKFLAQLIQTIVLMSSFLPLRGLRIFKRIWSEQFLYLNATFYHGEEDMQIFLDVF